MSLDPQIAGLLEALGGGFPDLPNMTGAQIRLVAPMLVRLSRLRR